jgi:hypothetical protein
MPAQSPAQDSSLPAQEVSQAMINLQAAQSDLKDGRPGPYTADNLQHAADALQQASAALAQTVLGQVNNQPEAPQQALNGSDDSPQGPGEGGAQGNRSAQNKAASIADLKEDFKSADWKGAQDKLKSGDSVKRKMQYDDYYRKANQQYLEKLMKDSKK